MEFDSNGQPVPSADNYHAAYPYLTDEQCVTLAMAAAGIRKGDGRLGSNVHQWRRGDAAEAGTLRPGDPVATFLDRRGNITDRYAGGGSGTPGAGLDHAAVFRRYVDGGMEVDEQFAGSGGVHRKQYNFGEGWGEKNGSNYFRVMTDKGPLGGGTESSKQHVRDDPDDREYDRNQERQATIDRAQAPHRNPAVASRGHFAHLHEIHGHLSDHNARIADLEARIERKLRKGQVTDVDAKNHRVRMEIGRNCDGSNQVKSPWLPYSQVAGGSAGLNVHSVPAVGEQVMLVNPDGSPDFSQGLVVRHGWYTANPSPSTDPDADVTTRGTTINVRSMTSIAHSIGGMLTGSLMSTITGGVTRLIDKLGHHISAPGATVDSTAQTHTHTSSETHTDSAMQGIAHTITGATGNIAATIQQMGNITHTATKGSIVNSAVEGAITSSSLTHSITASILNIQ